MQTPADERLPARLRSTVSVATAVGTAFAVLLFVFGQPQTPTVRLDLREWRCTEARDTGRGRVCDVWSRLRASAGVIR